jgi:hypothetical protein
MRSLMVGLMASLSTHSNSDFAARGSLREVEFVDSQDNSYFDFMQDINKIVNPIFLLRMPPEMASIVLLSLVWFVARILTKPPNQRISVAESVEISHRESQLAALQISLSDLPAEFQCPISQLIIADIPVFHLGSRNQQRFDRKFLHEWLKSSPFNPVTREAFDIDEMENDYILNAKIHLCLQLLEIDKANFVTSSLEEKKKQIGDCIKFIETRLKDVANNTKAVKRRSVKIIEEYLQIKGIKTASSKKSLSTSHLLSNSKLNEAVTHSGEDKVKLLGEGIAEGKESSTLPFSP